MAAPISKKTTSLKSTAPKKGTSLKSTGRPLSERPARKADSAGARSVSRRSDSWAEKLRGPRSLGYLLVFLGVTLIIQGLHTMEHIVQVVQIMVFGVPGAVAGGLLGSALDFPLVHFFYNFVLFLALIWAVAWAYGLGGFQKLDRIGMWMLLIAAGIQTYHTGEHVLQLAQEAAFATQRPNGFIGFFVPNFLAHLVLNILEWVFPFLAFWRFGGLGVMKNWLLTRRVRNPVSA
jgi:hypothetical protein